MVASGIGRSRSRVPHYKLLHSRQCFVADVMLDSFRIDRGCIVTDSERDQELHDNVVAMARESRKFLSLFSELDRSVRLRLNESVALHPSKCSGNCDVADCKT